MSTKSALRIQAILCKYYKEVSVCTVNTADDLMRLVARNPDLVFPGCKQVRTNGEHSSPIWLADYLDANDIQYMGTQSYGMKLDFDKASAKYFVQNAGLNTTKFFTTVPGQYASKAKLPFSLPFFIKPLNGGGGGGIGDDSVARTLEEFTAKVAAIYESHGSASLVEEYLTGREFSVAILTDNTENGRIFMPIEIITEKNYRGDRILGARVKHEDHELVTIIDDVKLKAELCDFANTAFNALGGRDYARIDIRMDADGNANFLEVNFMPAPGSRYFAGAFLANKNTSYAALLLDMVELAFDRMQESAELVSSVGTLFVSTAVAI
jgi:D-alanine-D-alanine ligase